MSNYGECDAMLHDVNLKDELNPDLAFSEIS